jgi:hypothetical protein
MDQPTIEKITQLEKRVQHIEDEIVDWQHWKTITRDSAHKIGIAEGLATSLQGDVIQLKVDVAKVSRQVATVIDNQLEAKIETDKRHEEVTKKLDLILKFLQP